jgi:hypothetical protein
MGEAKGVESIHDEVTESEKQYKVIATEKR